MIKLRSETKTEFKSCSVKPIKSKQRCATERPYVPLEKSTKTLNDLQKRDLINIYEEAQPSIERYQRSRQKIRNSRNTVDLSLYNLR